MVAVFLVGAVVALAGIARLPPDHHELFVLETAREMTRSGDWIVPRFEEEVRLTKPPLSYWLTGFTAAVDPTDHGAVEPWHGRMPSVLGGLLLAGLTMFLGFQLFDRSTGVLAGLVLVTTIGFFEYTHSARPEMLYAALCTGGLAAFVSAWRASAPRRRRTASLLMWGAFGLATLAEGPHLPLILLAAFAGFLLSRRRGLRPVLAALRPGGGLLLYLALVLPWWILVTTTLGEGRIAATELAGSRYGVDLGAILDPSFPLAALALVLPWVILVPGAIRVSLRPEEKRDEVHLLLWVFLLGLGALSLASRRHGYHALPLLGAPCLLLAAGSTRVYRRWKRAGCIPAWHLPAMAALACALAAWLAFRPDGDAPADEFPEILAGAVLLLVLAGSLVCGRRLASRGLVSLAGTVLVFAVALVMMEESLHAWSRERLTRARCARVAAGELPPGEEVVSLSDVGSLVWYYSGRHIVRFRHLRELVARLEERPRRSLLAILPESQAKRLPPEVGVRAVRVVGGPTREGPLYLVELRRGR